MKALDIAQVGKPCDELLHPLAQLGKAQKILENVAAVADRFRVVVDTEHQPPQVLALIARVGQRVRQKIYRKVVYRLGGELPLLAVGILRIHKTEFHGDPPESSLFPDNYIITMTRFKAEG